MRRRVKKGRRVYKVTDPELYSTRRLYGQNCETIKCVDELN